MRRLIFEHGLFMISLQFLPESSVLPLSIYSFFQVGHYTEGDKVLHEIILCYKALTGV